MKDIAKAFVMGRVGQDPEIHAAGSGSFATFSVAATHKYRKSNGDLVEETAWMPFVAWGKLAEIVEKYVKKGTPVWIEARIRQNEWVDKDSGKKRSKHEFVVSELSLLPTGQRNTAVSDDDGPPVEAREDMSAFTSGDDEDMF